MALSEGDESEALALLHSKTGRAMRGGLLSSEQIAILAKVIQATGIWGLDILNRLPEIELRSDPEKTAPPD